MMWVGMGGGGYLIVLSTVSNMLKDRYVDRNRGRIRFRNINLSNINDHDKIFMIFIYFGNRAVMIHLIPTISIRWALVFR